MSCNCLASNLACSSAASSTWGMASGPTMGYVAGKRTCNPCTFPPYCFANPTAYGKAASAAGEKSVANRMLFSAIRALAATAFISHLLITCLYSDPEILDVIVVTFIGETRHFHESSHERSLLQMAGRPWQGGG